MMLGTTANSDRFRYTWLQSIDPDRASGDDQSYSYFQKRVYLIWVWAIHTKIKSTRF
jgi:hypothetical protein